MIGSRTFNPPQLDRDPTDGLIGGTNSIAYRIHEIERHLHSYSRWFETAAIPSGESHVADSIGSGNGPFQIDAGNNDWGEWLLVLGDSDTPTVIGSVNFDFHMIHVESVERNSTYFMNIALGGSGGFALSNGYFSELVFTPQSNILDTWPIRVQMRRSPVYTKAWVRCKCPGYNTGTLDFYIGIHEYEG